MSIVKGQMSAPSPSALLRINSVEGSEKIIAGIDEVGRGSIAGPLAVGLAVCVWNREAEGLLRGIKDSKQLSVLKRKEWLNKIKDSGLVEFKIAYISAKIIDKNGLSWALKKGVERALKQYKGKIDIVYLDGGLKAPEEYNQETIIKGDEIIPIISTASIFAKVTRDTLMERKAREYPAYKWENNKGYGTKEHYKAIKKHGLCSLHRKSFLKNV